MCSAIKKEPLGRPETSLRQQPPPLAPQLDLTIKTRLPDWAGYYRDRILLYVYLTPAAGPIRTRYMTYMPSINITLPILFAYNLSPYLCSFLVSIRSEFVDNLSQLLPYSTHTLNHMYTESPWYLDVITDENTITKKNTRQRILQGQS